MIPWINPLHSVEPDTARREGEILLVLGLIVFPADAHRPPAEVVAPKEYPTSTRQPGALRVDVLIGAFVREPTPPEASYAFESGLRDAIPLIEAHFGARYRSLITGLIIDRPQGRATERAMTLIEGTTSIEVRSLAEQTHW